MDTVLVQQVHPEDPERSIRPGKAAEEWIDCDGGAFFLEWKWQATVAAAESRRPLSMKIMILLPGLVALANWHRQTGSDQADTAPGDDRSL